MPTKARPWSTSRFFCWLLPTTLIIASVAYAIYVDRVLGFEDERGAGMAVFTLIPFALIGWLLIVIEVFRSDGWKKLGRAIVGHAILMLVLAGICWAVIALRLFR